MANERLHLLADGSVTVEFKRPWSDGTRSIGLEPKALISRLAAIVPPPRRHVTVYSGVLASNSRWRRLIIPKARAMTENEASENAEGEEVTCPECGGRLRLIAMVKTQATIQEILTGMG